MCLVDHGTFKKRFCYGNPFSYCKYSYDFFQFLKLNYDIMRYNKLDKRVNKGTSVPFEMCMLPLIYPHYLCVSFYL